MTGQSCSLKLLLTAAAVLLVLGCRKGERLQEPPTAYYKFSDAEAAQIPRFDSGTVLRYTDGAGHERLIQVTQVDSSYRELYGVGVGFFSPHAATYFYYDTKQYRFEVLNDSTKSNFSVSYRKWPLELDTAMAHIQTLYPARMYIQISLFPYWNGVDARGYHDLYQLVPDTPATPAPGFTTPVIRIESNNRDSILSGTRDVHVLYYAHTLGIVGFDDLRGRRWRLQR